MVSTCDPNDCQDLPQHCREKDRKKCYNTNADRPQQVFGKEDCKCGTGDPTSSITSHFRPCLGQEQKGPDQFCLG